MSHDQKTNAARILDREKVEYDLVAYDFDPDNLAATHVAASLGQPIEQVFKTLVLRGDKTGILVCVIAGDKEIDLKKAARASGNKKVEMIAVKELLPLTGYIRGGCTAIGMKKRYPAYISADALAFGHIYVSAGRRGLQLRLAPEDLVRVAGAKVCDLT